MKELGFAILECNKLTFHQWCGVMRIGSSHGQNIRDVQRKGTYIIQGLTKAHGLYIAYNNDKYNSDDK